MALRKDHPRYAEFVEWQMRLDVAGFPRLTTLKLGRAVGAEFQHTQFDKQLPRHKDGRAKTEAG